MWEKLLEWVKKYPVKNGLISKGDLDNIYIAKTNKQAMEMINKAYEVFKKQGKKKYRKNIKRYKLNN